MKNEEVERLRVLLLGQIEWIRQRGNYIVDGDSGDQHSWNYATRHELAALNIPAEWVCQCIVSMMLYEEFAVIVDHEWATESNAIIALVGKLRAARPDMLDLSNKPMDDELSVFMWLGVNFCGVPERVLFSWYLKNQANLISIMTFKSRKDDTLFSAQKLDLRGLNGTNSNAVLGWFIEDEQRGKVGWNAGSPKKGPRGEDISE